MRHRERLHLSFKQFWHSPALIGITILKLVAIFLVSMLFGLLSGAILAGAGANMATIASVMFIVELIVFVILNGFFSAGFYAMARNAIQDGSTTLSEFWPGAKRYGMRFTGYVAIRWILISLLMMPFLFSVVADPSGVMQAPLTLSGLQIAWLVFFFLSTLLLVFYWLLWGEASLVFEDLSVWAAIKRSFKLANKYVMQTLTVIFISLLMFLLAFLVLLVILVPYQALFVLPTMSPGTMPPPSVTVLDVVIDFVTYMIFLSMFVVVVLFIFRTYEFITSRKRIKKKVAKSKRKRKK
ncbi:hypothetical protein GOV11_02550 [Candidatus Woesearchaeota archaeon]|nr:hypothetical protein [Candidatus Woesearchaeota archaeon]